MGRFSGVLLASDFDNTLIYTEAALLSGKPIPPLSEQNRTALEFFMNEGGRFAIATGRALAAFLPYLSLVPMNAPGIVCNGAALYDFHTKDYLEYAALDESARLRAQQVLDQFPQVAAEAYHIGNRVYMVQPNEITRSHARVTKVDLSQSESLLDVPVPLGKLLFEADRTTLEQVESYIQTQGWASHYELIFSGQAFLEMTAKGANKGGMVRRLAHRLEIKKEHVYCVGDEANDLSMLDSDTAAIGFAPANCVPIVRDSGAVLVSDAREHALSDVIEILCTRYPATGTDAGTMGAE